MSDNGVQASGRRSITLLIVKKRFVAGSPTKRFVRLLLTVIVFGIVFTLMIPARADTAVAPASGATANLESGSNIGRVEVDDLTEVPLAVIAIALALSVGLVMSSLGPRGLALMTAIGDRGH